MGHYSIVGAVFATFRWRNAAAIGRTMNQNISAFQDFREIATLPVAAALAALAVTWAVWYFTGTRCAEELAAATGCNSSAVAAFINPAMLKDIVTNSAIAATGGGVWSYVMITRERRAREAAEQALVKERERADEERKRADEEHERANEERRRADEERNRLLAEIERLSRQLDGRQEDPSG
jgi:signal transduction histidine kinase